jgi:hypothetical protein
MLLYTAYYMVRSSESGGVCPAGPCGGFDLSCSYDEAMRNVEYGVRKQGRNVRIHGWRSIFRHA